MKLDKRTFDKKIIATIKRIADKYYEGDMVETMFDFIQFIEKKNGEKTL